MAGKSGLNLTRDVPRRRLRRRLHRGRRLAGADPRRLRPGGGPPPGPRGLGIAAFTGSSGRVFPREMKASGLLRAWTRRLEAAGVAVRTRWRWLGWQEGVARFATPRACAASAPGRRCWRSAAVPGRSSGPTAPGRHPRRRGRRGRALPALERRLPRRLVAGDGAALRRAGQAGAATAAAAASPPSSSSRPRGIEGGGIYALGDLLRDGAPLALDLVPGRSEADVGARLARPRNGASLGNHLRKTLGLSPVKMALLRECAPQSARHAGGDGRALKALPLPLAGPRPLDEAISTAGGVTRAALDAGLMLRARPGVFCAGEMLDWDAPTGGYLLTACLATGRHAGPRRRPLARGALTGLQSPPRPRHDPAILGLQSERSEGTAMAAAAGVVVRSGGAAFRRRRTASHFRRRRPRTRWHRAPDRRGDRADQLGNHLGPAATGIIRRRSANCPRPALRSASSRCRPGS